MEKTAEVYQLMLLNVLFILLGLLRREDMIENLCGLITEVNNA